MPEAPVDQFLSATCPERLLHFGEKRLSQEIIKVETVSQTKDQVVWSLRVSVCKNVAKIGLSEVAQSVLLNIRLVFVADIVQSLGSS